MPAKRFWAMERQIGRIKAEKDLRELAFEGAKNDQDALKRFTDTLVQELGETYEIERDAVVKPERNVKEKFRKIMR
jgi:hypothetical protein